MGGGTVGLTIAAIGFLVSYFTGILIIHRGIRRGQVTLVSSESELTEDVRTGLIKAKEPAVGARLTFFSGAIEPLTFHLALIGGVYLLTYVLLSALSLGLVQVGLEREVVTLWSFNFVFANLLALGVRRGMTAREIGYLLDEGLLNRTTGLFADYLIAASIMAISLSVAYMYLWPLLVMCGIGAVATYFLVKWASERTFADFHFERFIGIYGEMTGTISSGLALVRVTDPEYQTPVAQDLVLGSGVALVLGFPLLLLINLPFSVFSGQLEGYWVVLGCSLVYLTLILWLWARIGPRREHATSL
jgi:ESS family glutamate:Na+ symporter